MGSGRTIDLNSSRVRFTAEKSLAIGQGLDLDIDWPVLLTGGIQVEFRASGVGRTKQRNRNRPRNPATFFLDAVSGMSG
jgi:hypothetical protein